MPPAQFAADEPVVPSDSAEEIRRRAREEREARLAAARNRTGGGPRKEAKQEQMQFEPLARGRFEKSEPTVVDGQDLDVPTFLRRKV
jgi:cell division protein FtsZ